MSTRSLLPRRAATALLLVVVLLSTAALAEPAVPLRLTIDDAVTRALREHPDIAAARRAVAVAEASLQRSKAWLPGNPYASGGAGTTTQQDVGNNYGFYISQEFEIGGQRSKRIGVATQDVAKASSELGSVQQTLAAAVKTAFLDALVAADRVTLSRQTVDMMEALNRRIDRSKRISDAQRITLNNAEIQEARARRELAGAQQARDNAQTTVRRLIGVPLDQPVELIGTPAAQIRPLPSEADLIARALRQRADLIAQRHDVERGDAQIALVRREQVPNITISGNVSRFEGATLTGGDVGLHLPIFQGKSADINEAVAAREQAHFTLESLERVAQQEVLEARRACEAAAAELNVLKDVIVPKTEENLELERRLFETGDVAYSDVVTTQLELLAARREYLDAMQTYSDAWVELERVVGGSLE